MLTWKRTEAGIYEDTTGRWRIERHESDDSWDTGALVKVNVQWTRYERINGEWIPAELHNGLRLAKMEAESVSRRFPA